MFCKDCRRRSRRATISDSAGRGISFGAVSLMLRRATLVGRRHRAARSTRCVFPIQQTWGGLHDGNLTVRRAPLLPDADRHAELEYAGLPIEPVVLHQLMSPLPWGHAGVERVLVVAARAGVWRRVRDRRRFLGGHSRDTSTAVPCPQR
jgi:hypothetical protein